ncbi:hypothetical protein L917_16728 [Phytophthora nicotianae]|uniref:Uncharacterized protein n=2 Tax=Phytophthora nicotianae TaxID=4792 RepID=W2R165_PHYN3|nr:hypothetical protein PPTG_21539 [Phytophthora nicotianae INRA-310]ETL83299.1 hypothetical protein L917_16728 [Phytophthora nicotianae]ETN18245.1 hypothetical protein PPTG_21539 [Phytophthora nicotianae INRA-310]
MLLADSAGYKADPFLVFKIKPPKNSERTPLISTDLGANSRTSCKSDRAHESPTGVCQPANLA